MPDREALIRAVSRRFEVADWGLGRDVAAAAVEVVLRAQAEELRGCGYELVRVSKELLEHLVEQESEPVVVIALERLEDGTCDMVLRTWQPPPADPGVTDA